MSGSMANQPLLMFGGASQTRIPSVSPISQLPTELVIRIFSSLIDQELADDGSLRHPNAEWMVVLRVCKLWRAIAENSAQLWFRISSPDPSLVAASLSRSKAHPLEIKLHGDYTSIPFETWELRWWAILCHVHRIHLLDMEFADGDQFLPVMEEIVHIGGMPILDTLILGSVEGHDSGRLVDSASFERCMPSLRVLRVTDGVAGIHFSSRTFCNLTALEMHNAEWWIEEDMSTFVSCMKEWKRLEELVLVDSLPGADVGSYPLPNPQFTISLPHLRYIQLEDPIVYPDYFLRHLELLPTTFVHLACAVWDTPGSEYESLTAIIRSLVSSISTGVLKSIRALYLHDDNHLIVRSSVVTHPGAEDHLHGYAGRLSLVLDNLREKPSACDFLGVAPDNNTFSGVEVLHISTRNAPIRSEWRASLRMVENVNQALLTGESEMLNEFIDALGEVRGSDRRPGTGGFCLPRLEQLTVAYDDSSMGDILLCALMARRDHGIPLRKLVVQLNAHGPGLCEVEESLRSVVSEVVIDLM